MTKELTVKQADFWRLLERENFLWKYFHARIKHRIPSIDNGAIYVEVECSNPTDREHAEQYIKSYLEPRYKRIINSPRDQVNIFVDDDLLGRLMKEYVVHIDLENHNETCDIVFHSLTLTVLYLAIDNFANANPDLFRSNPFILNGAKKILTELSQTFESEARPVNEDDQKNLEQHSSSDNDDDDNKNEPADASAKGPKLKTTFPGANPEPFNINISSSVKKAKKDRKKKHPKTTKEEEEKCDELTKEIREKLRGKTLRHIIIDGANVGRSYGGDSFSSYGIKLVVDHFQRYGFPDSKITVIVPPSYLSKDRDGVFVDLSRRKILHAAFHQMIDEKYKRFYDDRLIVDLAVVRQGVIISNDFYRDLAKDSGEAVRKAIRERLLCYKFFGDDLLIPNPVHEGGLSLDKFLTK